MLAQWGIWCMYRDLGGMGYPRICPMLKEGIPSTARSYEPTGVAPWELEVLDKEIAALEDKHRLVIMRCYRPGMIRAVEEHLTAMGTVERTWRRWLHEAAAILAGKVERKAA
jgi:hypothetical protein